MDEELCDLKVLINGQYTFILNQRTLCSYSARLKKLVKKQESKKRRIIKLMGFPGGAEGFELVSRFCFNNGSLPTPITPSNICLLQCAAFFLEMTEEAKGSNLLAQADAFLDGIFDWSWDEILTAIRSCEPFICVADSSGLLVNLISSLLSKILAQSKVPLTSATPFPCSPSSASSPDTSGFRCSSAKTPESIKNSFSKEWWFDDLSFLPPLVIERMLTVLGAYGEDNKNLILTRFLLHYLKRVGGQRKYNAECGGLADTAVYGVVLMGRAAFSCRGLFWVMRIVSGFALSRECRQQLERVIGQVLDQATLDDVLVSGHDEGVYDVNLVLRLVRVFVVGVEQGGVLVSKMKKVGKLIDKYLGEISPDQGLKVSKFLAVAESMPDSARDCFDGVYRALEIYLEAHPLLPSEDRTRLCRCLNYEKLTLEACKDLAKNPRVPPGAAVQAMVCQQSKLPVGRSPSPDLQAAVKSPKHSQCSVKTPKHHPKILKTPTNSLDSVKTTRHWNILKTPNNNLDSAKTLRLATITPGYKTDTASSAELTDGKEELRMNLQKMQNRVVELEKVCVEMKSQMSKMVGSQGILSRTHYGNRGLPRLC